MRELIRAGAQLDAVNIDGYAPIHTSAKVGDLPTLHELVEAGSSHAWRTLDNETPLTLACLGGHSDCVEYLVHKCKADPGARGYLEKTPLANAASKGHLAVVKVLLRCGVHRLGSNAFQEALFSVAMHARIDVLRELIAAEGGVPCQPHEYRLQHERAPHRRGFLPPACHVHAARGGRGRIRRRSQRTNALRRYRHPEA